MKLKLGNVYVCMQTPDIVRNCVKYVSCAENRILPLMKLISSEVNFGRREVVNPSAALFASTLCFKTLG
jgi:hypothetical protein